jgi:hypothetical protein
VSAVTQRYRIGLESRFKVIVQRQTLADIVQRHVAAARFLDTGCAGVDDIELQGISARTPGECE